MAKKSPGLFSFLKLKKKKGPKAQAPEPKADSRADAKAEAEQVDKREAQKEEPKAPRKPRRQVPNRQISPPGPKFLYTLPSELLLYTVEEYLDTISTISLSLTNKALYATIPRESNLLTNDEKIQLLTSFAPQFTSIQSHPHPYLCTECLKYHSLASTSLWPTWAPENTFISFDDFAMQPRVCVTHAIATRRWGFVWYVGGNKDLLLCEKCLGLYSAEYKRCSWNCEDCGKCVGRFKWSALCGECTRLNGGVERKMKYRRSASMSTARKKQGAETDRAVAKRTSSGRLYSYVGSSTEAPTSGKPDYTPASTASRGSQCSKCLGWRSWDPYSVETCRCYGSERDQLPGNTRMIYDGY